MLQTLWIGLDTFMAAVGTLVLIRWVLLLFGSVASAFARRPLASGDVGTVAVLVPAYNEEAVIEATVRSILASDHRALDVVVIDDGSRDTTSEVVRRLAAADDRVRLVEQRPNQGKSAALNRGIAHTTAEVVVTVDADTHVDPAALGLVARRMAATPDIAALACNVKVGNRRHWLGRWQSIEYISGIHVERRAQATLRCITTVPGAMAGWRRSALEAVGGFSGDTLTEDADLTLTLQIAGRSVRFEPRAVAWTEAPTTVGDLFRQRRRWGYGNLQCLWKHRTGLWRSRNPALAVLGLPNFFYVHLGGYLVVLAGLAWLPRAGLWLPPALVVSTLAGILMGDLAVACLAYALDRERFLELLHAPLQRLAWLPLLWTVFGVVVVALVSRRPVPWAKARRSLPLRQQTGP